jgi:deoxyribodipyrimidine photolyase-related protein
MKVSLVFPHQLFEQHPALVPGNPVVLIEEFLFFRMYRFHRQKLILHRASMRAWAERRRSEGYEVWYIEAFEPHADARQLGRWLAARGVQEIYLCDVTDQWLQQRLTRSTATSAITLQWFDSLLFLNTLQEIEAYFGSKKRFFQTDFYIRERKRRGWLLEADGTPEGGKWSFDTENRLKYPRDKTAPAVHFPAPAPEVDEAEQYVARYFPEAYGTTNTPFVYPTRPETALAWLDQFLEWRFREFGEYEDAMVIHGPILHHSVLTPVLNIGLLTPEQVMHRTLAAARRLQIPLNSTEGFIRQVTGWREFIRGVYVARGNQERTRNFWGFQRKIPATFWTGQTGIAPIDIVIRRVQDNAYCHHIERLMVLGNFMLLCEFDPDEVYRWFMEMFIDAYDWVMVPNVYGMSQFADGGLMATKPYISGSNYLMKMSDFPKGAWQTVWDGLFWRFMDRHRAFFLQNPRLGMLVKTFDKMPENKKSTHLLAAENYLQQLDGQ